MAYPAKFAPSPEGGYVITFRDIPEALSQADDLDEARAMAVDALTVAIDFYLDDKRPVPAPSKAKRGEELISLPVVVSAKVALVNQMLVDRVRPADLARAMGVAPQQVTRLLDRRHKTDIQTVADALRALGHRLELSVT
jgi:antitoxin HicB